MLVHEGDLGVEGGVGFCQGASWGVGWGRVGKEGDLRGEEDEARFRVAREGPDEGNGVAGFEKLDVGGGVHMGVDVDDVGLVGLGICCFDCGGGWVGGFPLCGLLGLLLAGRHFGWLVGGEA